MKFFKQNPVFSVFVSLFILLFIGGIVVIFMLKKQVEAEEQSVSRAESTLRGALLLEPAPTDANIEAAQKNVENLTQELLSRVKSTLGKKPTLLSGSAPASGTQMLFQLKAYRDEFAQLAKRTIPINVKDEEIERMQADGEVLPSTELPVDFAFGFSRYIDSGVPPSDVDVPLIYKQKEILNYVLRKLFNTRPISLVSVVRGPAELPAVVESNTPARGGNRPAGASLKSDEFRIGSESARVENAVETLAFKIVFTGYTENLRSFLKQIEEFEIPLVVRSVETVPSKSSVTVASAPATPPTTAGLFEAFGPDPAGGANEQAAEDDPSKEPIVEENVSEFTVVLEYITVTFTQDEKKVDGEEEVSQ